MNQISILFNKPNLNLDLLQKIEIKSDPSMQYIIAITPRSGSSYLCDVMTKTKLFGMPGEMLAPTSIAGNIKSIPGRTPDEYLRNAMRVRQTNNNISGLKTSWFQFENFISAMGKPSCLNEFKYIYLTRRDIVAQAVSLYKATASSVFHTNKQHSEEELKQLSTLEYNYEVIKNWYDHIVKQEKEWQSYFYRNRIFPLCISYEDIEDDILAVLNRIATYLEVNPKNISIPQEPSIFKKISDNRNPEWSLRFTQEFKFS